MSDERLFWKDSRGDTWELTGASDDVFVMWGLAERFMPPFRTVEELIPYAPGARLRDVQADVREIDVPIVVWGDTPVLRHQKLREWTQKFNPLFGAGQLINVAPDGRQRILNCWYASGFELDESLGPASLNQQQAIVVFRARDPFWYDDHTKSIAFEGGEATTFFPIFPLRLSSSEVFAESLATQSGDEVSWPIWTVQGPGSDPVFANVSTDQRFALVGVTLDDGDTLSVDTRPGRKEVLLNGATDLFGYQASDSVLWSLPPGTSTVQIELTASTEDSQASMEWTERFFAP